MHLLNMRTGKVVFPDSEEMRLARMRRRVVAWAEAVNNAEEAGANYRKVFITLTYRPGVDWEPNHIRNYVKRLKEVLGEKLVALAWVAEMQMRGAVHYHLYAVVKRGTNVPAPDRSGMWPHGLSNRVTGRTPFYLVSYLKKQYQKSKYPKGLRAFAVMLREDVFTTITVDRFRWSAYPAWLREELLQLCTVSQVYQLVLLGRRARPKKGGGWIVALDSSRKSWLKTSDDLHFESDWQVVW